MGRRIRKEKNSVGNAFSALLPKFLPLKYKSGNVDVLLQYVKERYLLCVLVAVFRQASRNFAGQAHDSHYTRSRGIWAQSCGGKMR